MQLASFKCRQCSHVQPQESQDFITHVRAWPATQTDVSTIVDMRMLGLYDGLKLTNPQLSTCGFLDGIATSNWSPLQVGPMLA
jgi:hypothetical protein